jgi:hypothetical protein
VPPSVPPANRIISGLKKRILSIFRKQVARHRWRERPSLWHQPQRRATIETFEAYTFLILRGVDWPEHAKRFTSTQVAVFILMLGSLLFLPAGRLDWPEAWVFLLGFVLAIVVGGTWSMRNNPDLINERGRWPRKPWPRSAMP